LVASVAVLPGLASAQEVVYTEAEVKAAFLYHFATYVQWPDDGDAPITIAVLGAPGVATQLETFLSGEPGRRIRDRAVSVRRLEDLRDLDSDHHVLFIGAQLDDRLDVVVDALGARPVLVVTDARDALERGAMINFQVIGQSVRFEISLVNAEEAGLTLSSRLLAAAVHVETSQLWIGTQPLAPLLAERARHCGRACRAVLERGTGIHAQAGFAASATGHSP
jgi:hypothetical protein